MISDLGSFYAYYLHDKPMKHEERQAFISLLEKTANESGKALNMLLECGNLIAEKNKTDDFKKEYEVFISVCSSFSNISQFCGYMIAQIERKQVNDNTSE